MALIWCINHQNICISLGDNIMGLNKNSCQPPGPILKGSVSSISLNNFSSPARPVHRLIS